MSLNRHVEAIENLRRASDVTVAQLQEQLSLLQVRVLLNW